MRNASRRVPAARGPFGAPARAALLAAVAAAALVAGCGTVDRINQANRIDYRSSVPARQAALDVPPDLTAPRPDDRFTIPARPNAAAPGVAAPGAVVPGATASGPPGGPATLSGFERRQSAAQRAATDPSVLPAVANARIERSGSQRWLVVDQPPGALWGKVREFWQENGFTIGLEQPEIGILETDWAENRAKLPQDIVQRTVGRVIPGLYDTSERDKFRVRLEPTADGGTEVYLSHRGAEEIATGAFRDQVRWQMRPSDPELEAEFLRRLLVKLGADQQRAQQVVAEAAGSSATRARLDGDTLQVDEGFERAWRRVGLALDRAGFTVEDRDRSQGLFFVRYADVEGRAAQASRPGFFARLLGRGGNASTDARRYRIRVQGSPDASQVQVLDRNGAVPGTGDDRRIATRILSLLQEELR